MWIVKTKQWPNKSNYLCWLVSHSSVMFVPAVMVYVERPIRTHSNPIVHLVYFDRFFERFPKMHLRLYHRCTNEERARERKQHGESLKIYKNRYALDARVKCTYVIALASTNINPCSSANFFASSYVTSRVLSKSDLFPIKNITVLGLVRFFVSVNQLLKWL